jgi:carboxynorspermidine decarboxylase
MAKLEDWMLEIESPCYAIEPARLERNLRTLDRVRQEASCKILLALKGYATWSTFGQIRQVLDGVCASGPHEARLGREEFGKEVHVYAPALSEADVEEILPLADKVVLNSLAQWHRHGKRLRAAGLEVGLRCNPMYSEVAVEIYNPCAPRSRLGILPEQFEGEDLAGIDGLHFHCLCEQNADTLAHVLEAFESHFGAWFEKIQWVNFGGGHHITRDDYDVDRLIRIIRDFKARTALEVILEPGEAVGLNAGVLVSTVLDVVENQGRIAILDTSAAAHMPDVLEMPYRPEVLGAGIPGHFEHDYRLAGLTCLSGDVIGDYSFPRPLEPGNRVVFLDMAHYTMVKNNTFNGMKLPSIALVEEDAEVRVVRRFGYEDYRDRLS